MKVKHIVRLFDMADALFMNNLYEATKIHDTHPMKSLKPSFTQEEAMAVYDKMDERLQKALRAYEIMEKASEIESFYLNSELTYEENQEIDVLMLAFFREQEERELQKDNSEVE